ncbi:MAG TPA: nucleotidyltransferase domain-containing protein [Bacilli bacterium]|jgi:hypothetical protein|nr:hypothetical protein [Acholeplasmataceae bacterium]HNZ78029.1 nucleotidyltransferase domain-containing protein [Bacilli bacterium]HOD61172.1 nucleotidyltransferase domain-containing protein [Bacilli bacterium]HOH62347.1 nucleotidyltransferase domain-containing protein [Bacilli bacterium]HPM15562.1 nucleotidyltransferase domain-containing protein [Bacilli bacterium]
MYEKVGFEVAIIFLEEYRLTISITYDIICLKGCINMKFKQNEYISKYNKNNYKMYQFRIKKSDAEIIQHLDTLENRNSYIYSLIDNDINKSIFTIKELKNLMKPIFTKYGITDIYLFGSYARGEATNTSDIDIYCNRGNIRTLIDQGLLEEELEKALNKKIDIIFNTSSIDESFKSQIMKDRIKLC